MRGAKLRLLPFPDSIDFIQRLGLSSQLKVHQGCVNSVVWSDDGNFVLSGSDDQHIVITNPFSSNVVHKHKTSHRANIFSARFLPQSNNERVISCSGDGIVMFTDLSRPQYATEFGETNSNYFNCHNNDTTYELLTVPTEPNTFMSCGEDGTVRLYDLRKQTRCHKTCCKDNILIMSPSSVTSL
jgi:nuclear receptor interaction protein